MLSLFRPSQIYFGQIFKTRRQLCDFNTIVSAQRSVNYEKTRKMSSSIVCCTDHSKDKLLNTVSRRNLMFQIYALQSFSVSSGFNDSRQSERHDRTLMVAGLSKDTTLAALSECFSKKWEVTNCKIVRDKQTGASLKYAFVEFKNDDQAKHALEFDHFIDGKEVNVKICGNKEFQENYLIFVGRLSKKTSQETLHKHFSKFGDISECHIVRNDNNLSRRFGYVTYKCQESVDNVLNSRPHRIDNTVVEVKHANLRQRALTLFIGNLSPQTTDESLREHFSKYGQLTQCDVKTDLTTGQSRGFGYVSFASQEELNRAMDGQQSHVIDGVEVRLENQTSNFDLMVDSLPRDMSEECLNKKLWDLFSRYGQVRDCKFIKNSAGTTTAFVSMSSRDEISRALIARPHRIDGKLVAVHQKGEQFSVYVTGLPKDAINDDLYETFSKVGNPVHWEVKRKRKTKRALGYAYVDFPSAEEVDKVMESRPYSIKGQEVTVQRRLVRKKKTMKN